MNGTNNLQITCSGSDDGDANAGACLRILEAFGRTFDCSAAIQRPRAAVDIEGSLCASESSRLSTFAESK